jgi:hypothetical protein
MKTFLFVDSKIPEILNDYLWIWNLSSGETPFHLPNYIDFKKLVATYTSTIVDESNALVNNLLEAAKKEAREGSSAGIGRKSSSRFAWEYSTNESNGKCFSGNASLVFRALDDGIGGIIECTMSRVVEYTRETHHHASDIAVNHIIDLFDRTKQLSFKAYTTALYHLSYHYFKAVSFPSWDDPAFIDKESMQFLASLINDCEISLKSMDKPCFLGGNAFLERDFYVKRIINIFSFVYSTAIDQLSCMIYIISFDSAKDVLDGKLYNFWKNGDHSNDEDVSYFPMIFQKVAVEILEAVQCCFEKKSFLHLVDVVFSKFLVFFLSLLADLRKEKESISYEILSSFCQASVALGEKMKEAMKTVLISLEMSIEEDDDYMEFHRHYPLSWFACQFLLLLPSFIQCNSLEFTTDIQKSVENLLLRYSKDPCEELERSLCEMLKVCLDLRAVFLKEMGIVIRSPSDEIRKFMGIFQGKLRDIPRKKNVSSLSDLSYTAAFQLPVIRVVSQLVSVSSSVSSVFWLRNDLCNSVEERYKRGQQLYDSSSLNERNDFTFSANASDVTHLPPAPALPIGTDLDSSVRAPTPAAPASLPSLDERATILRKALNRINASYLQYTTGPNTIPRSPILRLLITNIQLHNLFYLSPSRVSLINYSYYVIANIDDYYVRTASMKWKKSVTVKHGLMSFKKEVPLVLPIYETNCLSISSSSSSTSSCHYFPLLQMKLNLFLVATLNEDSQNSISDDVIVGNISFKFPLYNPPDIDEEEVHPLQLYGDQEPVTSVIARAEKKERMLPSMTLSIVPLK